MFISLILQVVKTPSYITGFGHIFEAEKGDTLQAKCNTGEKGDTLQAKCNTDK